MHPIIENGSFGTIVDPVKSLPAVLFISLFIKIKQEFRMPRKCPHSKELEPEAARHRAEIARLTRKSDSLADESAKIHSVASGGIWTREVLESALSGLTPSASPIRLPGFQKVDNIMKLDSFMSLSTLLQPPQHHRTQTCARFP
jgi:hypothetical protein